MVSACTECVDITDWFCVVGASRSMPSSKPRAIPKPRPRSKDTDAAAKADALAAEFLRSVLPATPSVRSAVLSPLPAQLKPISRLDAASCVDGLPDHIEDKVHSAGSPKELKGLDGVGMGVAPAHPVGAETAVHVSSPSSTTIRSVGGLAAGMEFTTGLPQAESSSSSSSRGSRGQKRPAEAMVAKVLRPRCVKPKTAA